MLHHLYCTIIHAISALLEEYKNLLDKSLLVIYLRLDIIHYPSYIIYIIVLPIVFAYLYQYLEDDENHKYDAIVLNECVSAIASN